MILKLALLFISRVPPRMKLASHKRRFGEGYTCALSPEGKPKYRGNRCSAKGSELGAGAADQCTHLLPEPENMDRN